MKVDSYGAETAESHYVLKIHNVIWCHKDIERQTLKLFIMVIKLKENPPHINPCTKTIFPDLPWVCIPSGNPRGSSRSRWRSWGPPPGWGKTGPGRVKFWVLSAPRDSSAEWAGPPRTLQCLRWAGCRGLQTLHAPLQAWSLRAERLSGQSRDSGNVELKQASRIRITIPQNSHAGYVILSLLEL